MGLREHTIFTEAANEDLKDVFGLAITVVTTAKSAKEAKAFLDVLGFPFKKGEAVSEKKINTGKKVVMRGKPKK